MDPEDPGWAVLDELPGLLVQGGVVEQLLELHLRRDGRKRLPLQRLYRKTKAVETSYYFSATQESPLPICGLHLPALHTLPLTSWMPRPFPSGSDSSELCM